MNFVVASLSWNSQYVSHRYKVTRSIQSSKTTHSNLLNTLYLLHTRIPICTETDLPLPPYLKSIQRSPLPPHITHVLGIGDQLHNDVWELQGLVSQKFQKHEG